MIKVYPIPPGLYCVPAAIMALTGDDLQAVVIPALNRAQAGDWLHGPVFGVSVPAAAQALDDMGWHVRRHKNGMTRHKVSTWAALSGERYADHRLLLATRDHMLAAVNGKVYDTYTPFGMFGVRHPCRNDLVTWAAALQRKS